MRAITKGAEPVALAQYRAMPGAVYDGGGFTPVKDAIREALLKEQGGLCAYCMQRIRADTMKVEHWHSRAGHSQEGLDYQNMLGCCPGNEGQPRNSQHCDTRKGNDDISLNPANPAHHARMKIRYEGDGTIRSDDPQFDEEIKDVLNLNWYRLRQNRKAVVEAVIQALSKHSGARTRREIQRLIDRWNSPGAEGCFREYCDVAVYYLNRRLCRT